MNNRPNFRDNLLRADGIDPVGVSSEELQWFRQLLGGRTLLRRIGKLAAAAAVLMLVAGGVYFFAGSTNRVWAQVLDNVRSTNNFQCRMVTEFIRTTVEGEKETAKTETLTYASEQHGLFIEDYANGELTGRTYVLFDSKKVVRISYTTKECWRQRSSETREDFTEEMDPRQWVIRTLEGEYSKLGRQTVNGRTLAGIESHDSSVLFGSPQAYDEFVLRLWIDVATRLPVSAEIEYAYATEGRTVQARFVTDRFQWNQEFSADLFTPDIPAGYTLWTDRPDEIACINSLRLFAESTGGKYPSRLDRGTMNQEMQDVEKTQQGISVRQMASGEYRRDTVWDAMWFEKMLVAKGHNVAYYGDRVTPADANAVLMHWDLSETERRVIWGDLRIETMSVTELARHCLEVRQAPPPAGRF